jgi:hypothetical protein
MLKIRNLSTVLGYMGIYASEHCAQKDITN